MKPPIENHTLRLNVGCGRTPTRGWENFDNSFSLRLARRPLAYRLAAALGLLDPAQRAFIEFARRERIRWADVSRKIPCADNAADVMYTSHMLEHLDRREAAAFLAESLRVLRPGGMIRIAVPDLRLMVDRYLAGGDADAFIEATHCAVPKPRSFRERLRLLIAGPRHHHWLYDGASLCALLRGTGFSDPAVRPAGATGIPDPGELDLREREAESLYVEAVKPRTP